MLASSSKFVVYFCLASKLILLHSIAIFPKTNWINWRIFTTSRSWPCQHPGYRPGAPSPRLVLHQQATRRQVATTGGPVKATATETVHAGDVEPRPWRRQRLGNFMRFLLRDDGAVVYDWNHWKKSDFE